MNRRSFFGLIGALFTVEPVVASTSQNAKIANSDGELYRFSAVYWRFDGQIMRFDPKDGSLAPSILIWEKWDKYRPALDSEWIRHPNGGQALWPRRVLESWQKRASAGNRWYFVHN